MTSPATPSSLLRDLSFADDESASAPTTPFAFDLDFDSSQSFPDLPYDPAAAAARYADDARASIRAIVDTAARALGKRAPKARVFVDDSVDRLMVRSAAAVAGTASSSNRTHVGICVLTNVEASPEPALICVEALVHEGTHQFLYRIEEAHGPFCDLDATRRYRSPWSGNRIPLHSLVHASFVYHALLSLWAAFASRTPEPGASAFARDRVARSLFGYRFLGELMGQPTFPRNAVRADILEAIFEIGRRADALEIAPTADRPFRDALADAAKVEWFADVRHALAQEQLPA